jgi:hypothetical protein
MNLCFRDYMLAPQKFSRFTEEEILSREKTEA